MLTIRSWNNFYNIAISLQSKIQYYGVTLKSNLKFTGNRRSWIKTAFQQRFGFIVPSSQLQEISQSEKWAAQTKYVCLTIMSKLPKA